MTPDREVNMLNATDCLALGKEIENLAKQLKIISMRLEQYVIEMEYNQQALDSEAVKREDGSYLLLNDDETESLIKTYGGRE